MNNMPDLIPFIQLGVAGVSVIIILLIVKAFLNSLDTQEKDFKEIIVNHLHKDTELHEKTIEAMKSLEQTQQKNTTAQEANAMLMREMLNYLKNHK